MCAWSGRGEVGRGGSECAGGRAAEFEAACPLIVATSRGDAHERAATSTATARVPAHHTEAVSELRVHAAGGASVRRRVR